MESEIVIEVNNATKSFSGGKILDNLNLKLYQGEIYGLLGASGQGKTTLISAIINEIQLEHGSIRIFGRKFESLGNQNKIGYMPQDLLEFYSDVFGLTRSERKIKIQSLQKHLHLPNLSQYVDQLSGGEKRRASLMIALLHSPKILILDEPTTGIDSLIRESIWNYLKILANEGTSILITTHYSEEATLCNRVGFIHNGSLAIEGNPQEIMATQKTHLFEIAVLQILKQMAQNPSTPQITQDTFLTSNSSYPESKSNSRFPRAKQWKSGQGTMALFKRHLVTKKRTIVLTLSDYILPAIALSLLVTICKDPGKLKLAVVNHETNYSCDTYWNPGQNVSLCLLDKTSCSFLKQFTPDKISLDFVSSEEKGLRGVETGKYWGYLTIPQNFTKYQTQRYLLNRFATSEEINGSTISVRLDMSNKVLTGFMIEEISSQLFNYGEELISSCKDNLDIFMDLLDIPFKLKAVEGSLDPKWVDFLYPGFPLLILCSIPLILTSSRLIEERRSGSMSRASLGGVSMLAYFNSYMLLNLFISAAQFVILTPALVFLFGWELNTSLVDYLILAMIFTTTMSYIGFLLGCIFYNELEGMLIILGIYGLNVTSSGFIWPLESVQPSALRIFYRLLPLSMPMDAGRLIITKGWRLWHPKVFPTILYLVGSSVIYFLVIVFVCSRRK